MIKQRGFLPRQDLDFERGSRIRQQSMGLPRTEYKAFWGRL